MGHRAALADTTSLVDPGDLTCPLPILSHIGLLLSCIEQTKLSLSCHVFFLPAACGHLSLVSALVFHASGSRAYRDPGGRTHS